MPDEVDESEVPSQKVVFYLRPSAFRTFCDDYLFLGHGPEEHLRHSLALFGMVSKALLRGDTLILRSKDGKERRILLQCFDVEAIPLELMKPRRRQGFRAKLRDWLRG